MSYKALVARVHVRPHPNADRLQIGSCAGYQVIVGKDVIDGELGLFFEQGGQLSEEFCRVNDLIRRKDEDGKPAGGMFESNRRVRGMNLRGERTEGFWCPLHMLYGMSSGDGWMPLSTLNEGDEIDEWCGVKICQRYETPATRSAKSPNFKQRKQNAMFAKHIDTKQLRRCAHEIPDGALCIITEKLHGTSFRYGRVLDDVPIQRGVIGRCLAWLLKWPKTTKEWVYLHGSRNVVLEHNGGTDGFYGTNQFRFDAMRGVELHKGEILYGELVGYAGDKPIMPPHDTRKRPELAKQYGERMVYAYGCEPGTCKAYVYRITQTNEDGVVFELPWVQVKRRCNELGLLAVPEVAKLHSDELCPQAFLSDIHDCVLPSILGNHIAEGWVVRYESETGTGWLKQKTYPFSVLEGILKDDDSYVDTEEAA